MEYGTKRVITYKCSKDDWIPVDRTGMRTPKLEALMIANRFVYK